MGLDWNPGNKAKPGYEQEFRELWLKLHTKALFRSRKVKRFKEITVTAFTTLGAPQVGFDENATEWARKAFPDRTDKSLSLEEFIERMRGFYVLDLVPSCDGLPRYTNGYPGGYGPSRCGRQPRVDRDDTDDAERLAMMNKAVYNMRL